MVKGVVVMRVLARPPLRPRPPPSAVWYLRRGPKGQLQEPGTAPLPPHLPLTLTVAPSWRPRRNTAARVILILRFRYTKMYYFFPVFFFF